MTDKQIIKALECCADEWDCDHCPYFNKCSDMKKDALDLINRKNAEIEELRKAKVVYETVDYSSGDLEDALEEIDRLKIENDSLRTAGNSLKMHLKKAKEETEGLKNKIEHLVCFLVEVRIDAIKEFIDNRIKELTEEQK